MRISKTDPVIIARLIRETVENQFTPQWREENAVEFEHIVDNTIQIYCNLRLINAIDEAANANG